MDGPSICPLTCRHNAEAGPRPHGFSLLEMMMVVTVILEAVSPQPSAFS
jgi:prepilin-type N-terminal cleavage/methylation domain-containing protein